MTNETVVEILGPGCPRCKETFRVVTHVVETELLPVKVVKNESIARMVELGALGSPALAINGKLVLAGRIPKAEEVRELLRETLGR